MPEISVVVPTYNRLETLERVLPTLLQQDLPPSAYELLICDSNSTDGTAEFMRTVICAHDNVRHLAGSYGGRAAARNAGIAAARGSIVLFNDADIFASANLLSAHLRRHRRRKRIAVVGWEVQVKNFDEYLYKRDRPHARGHLHPPSRKRLSWLYFLTGNASVARDDLVRAGCFDETFTGYGHEDLELGYRLRQRGVDIVYEPGAVNFHCQDVGYEDQKSKMLLAGRSAARFYRKHPHFEVKLKLGMTPLSLGAHSMLSRMPHLLGYLDRQAERSRLARELLLQYFYVAGVKDAG
ncbi:MAG: glycosyltransferase family 2 protein [Candidatus Eremiobacteraeota bacterium]|nr:glycosyltransferase family 2 protein [Candidatus Eremiobacteraeota bacterium]MBV9055676.1 glycosyltransferase family 2 protein [Candidatus Eremiobacteraeota bacterium]MBV9698910.1 glycosyltransferase family 2 protein [Candidatus Eremiobacteraeota bacterium]